MAVWPASLPDLPIDLQETRQKGFLRTEMDAGPHKQRKRFTAVSRYIRARDLLIDKDQRQTLDTFYSTTLGEGGDSFEWSDPVDAGNVNFRFVEPPEFRAVVGGSGGVALWRVTLTLEILPS